MEKDTFKLDLSLMMQNYISFLQSDKQIIATHSRIFTLVKTSRIYTGQYTFPILLLNDDNMLGEHKGREKNIVYGRLF